MAEFEEGRPKAVAVLVVGMAGAGKTTLMHRLNLHMVEQNLRGLEKAHFFHTYHTYKLLRIKYQIFFLCCSQKTPFIVYLKFFLDIHV